MKKSIKINIPDASKDEINEHSTVVRHEYDIDVFQIYDELKKIYSLPDNKEIVDKHNVLASLEEEENIYVKIMNQNGIDLSENQKCRHYIIPSSSYSYLSYLGWKILSVDPYKIEALLSYQSTLFQGNHYAPKDNFIGFVEYLVYGFVRARNYLKENIRFEKIMNWVERNRVFILNKTYSDNIKVPALKLRVISMEAEFANILYQKMQPYFAEEQHKPLFDLIMKDKKSSGLCFNGNRNSLAEFFKRLRYNKRIVVAKNEILAKWITENFVVLNQLNETEHLNYETILNVLKKVKNEPPKGKRILEDLAEYLPPSQRKDKKEALK